MANGFDPNEFEQFKKSTSGGFDPKEFESFKSGDTPINREFDFDRIDKLLKTAGFIANEYKKSQFGSPQDLLQTLDKLVNEGADKAGAFAEKQAKKEGIGDTTARFIGKTISTAPEITSFAQPATSTNKALQKGALSATRRGLGFQKSFMKSRMARGKAAEAAEVALKEGAVPFTGNPAKAESVLRGVAAKSGQKLSDIRESVEINDLSDFANDLENLRFQMTAGGARGGKWDIIHSKIDEAKDTVMGLLNKKGKVTLNDVAKARKQVTSSINFLSERASNDTAFLSAKKIERTTERILGKSGKDVKGFKKLKKTFGGAKSGIKALQNELAAQSGNMAISPVALISGAVHAPGNPAAGVAAAGLIEALRKRGGLAMGRLLDSASRTPLLVPGSRAASPFMDLINKIVGDRASGQ